MGLAAYRRKRHFKSTPEPTGNTRRAGSSLRFVVQKHDATRLHYDFRLELDGVLKSWAVPKGPSLDPADKRLAVMVEDHPLDYRTFEGTIPKGNYGAGEVIVWDQGTYYVDAEANRSATGKAAREGLERGRLSITLEGEKLRGEFTLIRMQRGGPNNWLLFKKQDEYASTEDITANGRSVISNRTIDMVAKGLPKATVKKSSSRSKPRRGKDNMPHDVKPMLATLVDMPFDREGWIFEPKWDGYRALAEVRQGGVRIYSRNHTSFEHYFAPIVAALKGLGHDAVLDGEVVVVDETGKSQFQLLQQYRKTGKGNLLYYVFDLLYLDGHDLRKEHLLHRKQLLAEILDQVPQVRLSEHIETEGEAFFQAAAAQGLEGVIAKNGESPYQEGTRSLDWLKVKTHQRQEAVIGGFTEPRGSRNGFGALVLGVYEHGQLVYIGHTGGGFDTKGLENMRTRLEPLIQERSPFRDQPKTNAPAHWVKPRLVCEVAFQQWTADGRMRQPIFVGMREDKPAKEVRRENPKAAQDAVEDPVKEKPRSKAIGLARAGKVHSNGSPNLTNLQKIYWPGEGYTKGDLIAYYREMAPVLLPHLRDRPQSLHRHPDGIEGKHFFQKDVGKHPPPPWVETVKVRSESDGADVTYLVCQNEKALLYVANLGCIELNPWNSRIGSLDRPDYLIIDLDPENITFRSVVEAAQAVRKLLDKAGAISFCKTSGKRGLHICVPLGAKYVYDAVRQFAEIIARLVNAQLPGSTSIVRSPRLRQRRVYLDYLQNRVGQTLAAPYSLRPAPGATVSTPLRWAEVKPGLDPTSFTIRTVPKRVDRIGDLWKPLLGKGIDLENCMRKLDTSVASL